MSNKIKVIRASDSDSDAEIVENPVKLKNKPKKVQLADDSVDVQLPQKEGKKPKIKKVDSADATAKKKIPLDDSEEKVVKKPATKKKIQLDDEETVIKKKIQLDDSDEKVVNKPAAKKKPVAKKVPKISQTPQQIAEEVKSRIIEYLTDREEFVPTLEIAKYIYGEKATRQMVNKELYALLKKGIVEKQAEENGTKPHWKIV